MDESTTKPLEGVLVVALEQAVAAPLATCRLADAGARVIKLERREGDFARAYDTVANGQSAYFAWANRGKESLVVDIKKSSDVSLIQRIVSKADVFIQNLGVGAAARVGLGSTDLRAQYPRLITCDISGYGEKGPYATMKAYDLLVQAESGLVSVSGAPGEYGRVGVSVCDIATGVSAALAVNEAIIGRESTGQGTAIHLSLFDVMAEWMSVPLLQYDYGGTGPNRVGLAHPSITPYGGFVTKDGATLVISIQNEREWRDLVTQVLNMPELESDPAYIDNSARMQHREQVDALVQKVFAAQGRQELERQLSDARIAFGAVNGLDELSKHPQLRRIRVLSETGEIDMPAHPDASRVIERDTRIPGLGEHSDAIRVEFSGK
ncbi:MAG: CaiB/BaiF CoA-transferase family protein [Pseudomonadota bacterium]|nr:CaiB/BaiF CoA-transferase family protein [Pseudomonadota bacterium]